MTIKHIPAERSEADEKAGKDLFAKLVREWAKGFDDPEAKQPDRVGILRDVEADPDFKKLYKWVEEKEFFQTAVYEVLEDPDSPEKFDKTDRIAANIFQVASVVVSPFYDLCLRHMDHTGQKWRKSFPNAPDPEKGTFRVSV